MARTPSAFRQQDVTRAIRAADAAGCPVRRVEIDRDGKIVLVIVDAKDQPASIEAGADRLIVL